MEPAELIIDVKGTPGSDKAPARYTLTSEAWVGMRPLGYVHPVTFEEAIREASHRFTGQTISFMPLDDCARKELHTAFNGTGQITLEGKTYTLADQESIITPEQTISYQYLGVSHELRNGNSWANVKDLKRSLLGFIKKLEGDHKAYFVVPKDPASRLELQMAFGGEKELHLDDKVVLIR